MLARETKEEEEERVKKQKQETFDKISETGKQIGKGIEMIVDGFSTTAINITQELYSIIYEQGPATLNEMSADIMIGGTISGLAISTAGVPEVGVPLIGFSAATSTALDATATAITLIDWNVNGGSERGGKFGEQILNLGFGIGSGKMSPAMGKRLGEFNKAIDWKAFEHFQAPSGFKYGF